ncbi:MAG: polyribonucleotide nucleotidyltransferase [bacterium]
MEKVFSMDWNGSPLTIKTGKLAKQASASALVSLGETIVLAAVVMSPEKRTGIDFFPLQVEYEEKLYAAGKIKGSRFIKREGRPTDDATLIGRLIDRSVRPLFNDAMRNEIQLIVSVLSFDGVHSPDVVGLIAASTVLHMSKIPWAGPIAGAKVGRVDGEWKLNPSYEDLTKSDLELFVAGNSEKVLMIEAGGNEVPETEVYEAIMFAKKHFGGVCDLIEQVRKAVGHEKVNPLQLDDAGLAHEEEKDEILARAKKDFILASIEKNFFKEPKADKVGRREAKGRIKTEFKAWLKENSIDESFHGELLSSVDWIVEEQIVEKILAEDRRVDGRGLDEIRELTSEVALFSRNHGTGLFSRGETQVLTVATLGAPGDAQTLDGMEVNGEKRFMHHYNFPPYSVGEVKPMRGPGRREIGHGALAEKALERMIPAKEIFPYTIRLVSEVLGSNGSSSMGSACGSTLALMDAGVPIKAPVAGLAMGLASVAGKDGHISKYKIITDLSDLEDGTGGMDFKVAGTRKGMTAIQLDTKTLGLSDEIVKETLTRANTARMRILDVMKAVIAEPRKELSPFAPRIITLKINPELIRIVIGPGGKQINEIIAATGVSIDIEDDGTVFITGTNAEMSAKAVDWVNSLTREVKVGETFRGKVTRIMDFGAFVEVAPKNDGLVHISELAPFRVGKVTDVVNIGDVIPVKVIEIDELGRINLSYKQAAGNKFENMDPSQYPKSEMPPRTGGKPFQKN